MQRENEVQHVFLVGAKSLGAYGSESQEACGRRVHMG